MMIAGIFEAEGFAVRAPHEVVPDLVAPEGVLGRAAPALRDRADTERAAAIVAALGAADVGQAAVVGTPATSILSFTAKGTPARGRTSPAAKRRSTSRA